MDIGQKFENIYFLIKSLPTLLLLTVVLYPGGGLIDDIETKKKH